MSDETEVMDTEPPAEPDRDKRARTAERRRSWMCQRNPRLGIQDSWWELGDDLEFEPDEEDEAARSDPGDEERLKTRGGTHDRNLQWRYRHPSARGCAIYSRGRG